MRKSEGLKIRLALPSDQEALSKLLDQKECALWAMGLLDINRRMLRPPLFEPPTILTLVVENCEGELVDGLSLECCVDVTKLSINSPTLQAMPEVAEDLAAWLKQKGFRLVHAVIPRGFGASMQDLLAKMGFRSSRDKSSHWFRWL